MSAEKPGYTKQPTERSTSMRSYTLDLGINLTGLMYVWTIIAIVLLATGTI